MLYVVKVKDKDLFFTRDDSDEWISEIPLIVTLKEAETIMNWAKTKIPDLSEDNWYQKEDLEIRQITYQII
jgi:hypothetical protein